MRSIRQGFGGCLRHKKENPPRGLRTYNTFIFKSAPGRREGAPLNKLDWWELSTVSFWVSGRVDESGPDEDSLACGRLFACLIYCQRMEIGRGGRLS